MRSAAVRRIDARAAVAAYLRRVGHFAVSVVGRDRPGIVAGIATALLDLDGNIEDSRMTILRGHFAMTLVVTVPESAPRQALLDRLGPLQDELALEAITVSGIDELAGGGDPASHVISVYGADHPGIVQAVSSELAAGGVNITDLQTKLAGGAEQPLYVMLMEVALGSSVPEELEERLAGVADRASVEISIRKLDSEAL